ncbi:MAG: protein tyrosine phosphatase [Chamaesiphon sp.]|nr:protein tyrosine phosphatase [Chamaesiphon sp.]
MCSRNQWRSSTAAALFKDNDLYAARSAGTSDSARIKITAGLINWADRLFVMEKRHLAIIHRKYGKEIEGKSIVVLNITDDYQYMDSELIEILKSRLSEHLKFGESE